MSAAPWLLLALLTPPSRIPGEAAPTYPSAAPGSWTDAGRGASFPCPPGTSWSLTRTDALVVESCVTQADATVRQGPEVAWLGLERRSESWYLHDRLHGPSARWCPNGAVQEVGSFAQGQRDGWTRSWTCDGLLVAETLFEAGRPTHSLQYGPEGWLVREEVPGTASVKEWYPDGAPRRIVEDKGGNVRTAEWRPDGTPIRAGAMRSSRPHGPWGVWIQDPASGQVERVREWWKDGQLSRARGALPPADGACPPFSYSYQHRAQDGTTEEGCRTLSGFGNGPFQTRRPDGSLLVQGARTGGILSGTSTWFCQDGSVRLKEVYRLDRKGLEVLSQEQGTCAEDEGDLGL